MENTLRSHLIFLNHRLQELTDLLTRPTTPSQRANIEARVALAQQAIDNYRRAYDIEASLRSEEAASMQQT